MILQATIAKQPGTQSSLVLKMEPCYPQPRPLAQQNLGVRKIAILILRAPTNRLRHLRELMPATREALEIIRPGQVVLVT